MGNYEDALRRETERLAGRIPRRELERLYVQARMDSMVDHATGANSRFAFSRTLPEEVARAHRHMSPLSFLMLDCDGLKPINDGYGHDVGDAYLAELVDVLRGRIEEPVYRLGGDEFGLLLHETAIAGSSAMALRKLGEISDYRFEMLPPEITTVSMGLAALDLKDDHDTGMLLYNRADRGLRYAKSMGKNTLGIFDPQHYESQGGYQLFTPVVRQGS
jgi:diguanylate cyclase